MLTFGWGELAVVIVTAIVFAVGVKTRLKSEEVITNVENTKESSAEHLDGGETQTLAEAARSRTSMPATYWIEFVQLGNEFGLS